MSGEDQLVKRLRQGDLNAFRSIYEAYSQRIFQFALHFVHDASEAQNIVQEVFLALWENREKLHEKTELSPYLYRISRNLSIRFLRKAVNRVVISCLNESISGDTDETILNNIHRNELRIKIDMLINQMPARRKEIFMLCFYEGLSYKEIAEQLLISENTVDTQIRNALRFLRTILTGIHILLFIIFIF